MRARGPLQQVLADSVLSRPELPRRRLADHRHALCSIAIGDGEVPSRHDRSPQCREVPRLHDVPIHVEETLSARGRHAWNRQRLTPHLEAARQEGCDRRGLHPGQIADAIDQLSGEARSGRVGISGLRKIDRRELDAVRIETQIDRGGPLERPHEQARADDEHEAERHLAHDKCVPKTQPAREPGVVSEPRQDIRLRRLKRRRQPRHERRHE